MLAVRLTPRAGADRIDGWETDASGRRYLKVRVRAAPVDGEANAALEVLLAKTLGVAKSSVRVARGASARLKQVAIEGLDPPEIEARLSG